MYFSVPLLLLPRMAARLTEVNHIRYTIKYERFADLQ